MKTATRDIPVWKAIRVGTNSSPFRGNTIYEKGQTATVGLPLGVEYFSHANGTHTGKVERGLHACVTQEAAIKTSSHASKLKIVQMVIPKGAKYIRGLNGHIVSNKLTWKQHGRTK